MSGTFHEDVPPESTINVTTIINGRRMSKIVDLCSFAQTVEQRPEHSSSSFTEPPAGQSRGQNQSQKNHVHACPPHQGWGLIRRGDNVYASPEVCKDQINSFYGSRLFFLNILIDLLARGSGPFSWTRTCRMGEGCFASRPMLRWNDCCRSVDPSTEKKKKKKIIYVGTMGLLR